MTITRDDLKHQISLPNDESEYWKRMRWCKENAGEMMGHSDNIEGKWFHYQTGTSINGNHVFVFFDEKIAAMFALIFLGK